MLANLLGNAHKFTPEGGRVALDVGILRRDGRRCVLRFAVADTGVGIPGPKQTSIFHAFTQLDGRHARRFGGTGLGLAIASHLVRLMGGELRVTSQVDRGSTFWFTLPVDEVVVPAEEPPRAPHEATPAGHAPLRVLLAEDNRVNQKVAARAVERCGHQVVVVEDGLQAVRATGEQPFDCVLMDLQMPGMDGTDATRAIRERERETGGHLRIIALTANAMEGDREACLAAGMDDYLAKPLHLDDLRDALERALERRSPRLAQGAPALEDIMPLEADEEGPLRLDVLDALRGDLQTPGDGGEFAEIIDLFLGNARRNCNAVRDALASGDRQSLELAAHSLKGSSSTMGAVRLAALCASLEEAGHTGALERAATLAERLDTELDLVQRELVRHR